MPARVTRPPFVGRPLIDEGSQAPDFELQDQDGHAVRLSTLLQSGPVVLYFYPKDETPGCTVEACGFRDDHVRFVDVGATVVGVSDDSVQSHRSFIDRHRLPFTLLSDVGGKVRKLYGIPKTLGLMPGRVTYVIDTDRTVRKVFSSQIRPWAHIQEALDTVRALSEGRAAQQA